jgi:hypothetical protein
MSKGEAKVGKGKGINHFWWGEEFVSEKNNP